MKTHIIQLHEHDNVNSTQDKMRWCKEPRVLLDAGGIDEINLARLDFVRLQHQSRKQGIQIALVTKIDRIKLDASLAQIPVFDSIETAQKSTWRRRGQWKKIEKREKHPAVLLNHNRPVVEDFNSFKSLIVRISSFLIGIAAVFLLVLFFIPGAEIDLPLVKEQQNLDLKLKLNPKNKLVSVNEGIPSYTRDIVLEDEQQIASTGNQLIPDKAAEGEAIFTNLTDQAIVVPVGMVISTISIDPVRFETEEGLSLGTGKDSSRTVKIRAMEAGISGNVIPGEIVAVQGEIASKVSVLNSNPTSGGTERTVRSPSQEDFLTLKKSIQKSLENKGLEYFNKKIGENEKLVPGTLELISNEEEQREPAENLPADFLKIRIKARYSIWYIKLDEVKQIIKYRMDAELQRDNIANANIDIRFGEKVTKEGSGVSWDLKATRLIKKSFSENQVARAIAGNKLNDAKKILMNSFSMSGEPTIKLYPGWWDRLPYFYLRIKFLS